MVILLLEHGANPNLICKYVCRLFSTFSVVQSNAVGKFSNIAPLHIAAAKGIIQLCELLITHGADVNLVAPKAGTPLHVAVSRDHRFIFECLLKYTPDLNVVNHHGETVLHMAARLGCVKNCFFLSISFFDRCASVFWGLATWKL
jgi:ankyrin repeat protein